MKNNLFIVLLLLHTLARWGNAQVKCTATAATGSGYAVIENAGLAIENPDCEHSDFGAHITQTYDVDLNKNVFVFHSHINEDNDRCIVFDRVRMEIKGGPGTSAELQHPQGTESFYRWKFRLNDDFEGASTFNHIFQNKAYQGADAGFPILTITPRAEIIEVRHNGGDTGNDLGRLATADLDLFRGKWIEAFIRQKHDEAGELEITLTDIATGSVLLEYTNSDIDLWRVGSTYNRPKWGMYRAKNSILKEEEIRLADFCISETSETLCPAATSSIKSISEKKTVNVFPIPSSGQLFVELAEKQNAKIDFYSLDGKKVQTNHLPKGDKKIDVSNISSGFYFLNIKLENGEIYTEKISLK